MPDAKATNAIICKRTFEILDVLCQPGLLFVVLMFVRVADRRGAVLDSVEPGVFRQLAIKRHPSSYRVL